MSFHDEALSIADICLLPCLSSLPVLPLQGKAEWWLTQL